jgi:DHA1 family inner membrane transport protein
VKATPKAISATLFLCLFAAQAGAIALAPVLVEVARDLDVSTAAAGQLRTVAGLAAGAAALVLGRLGTRVGLGRQLLGGSILLASGSVLSAVAPGIVFLAVSQVPVGAGIGVLTTAATLAAAEWVSLEHRSAVLSWTLLGQPFAWIVGMPLLGTAGEVSWRCAWLAFPLVAALLAAAAVAGRRGTAPASTAPTRLREALAAPEVRRWLAADALANTGWAGTLVYAGAFFVQSYETSAATTGVLLAICAAANVAGNATLRRFADGEPWRRLVGLTLLLATAVLAFGNVSTSPVLSVALLAAGAFAAGGRALVSSAYGLSLPADIRAGATAMRSATMQFGYFTGSLVAGAALAWGGYPALGTVMSALFLAAVLAVKPVASSRSDGRTSSLRRARSSRPRLLRARAAR